MVKEEISFPYSHQLQFFLCLVSQNIYIIYEDAQTEEVS